MFWELAPGEVFVKDVDLRCPETERIKLKMEKASRWTWETQECNLRTNQLRESTLKEFWDIFVDDSPYGKRRCLNKLTSIPKQRSPAQ